MFRYIMTLLPGLLICSMPVYAIEIEGVEIPETDSSADSKTTLVLNGAGLREKFFVDVYVGALYLQAKTPDAHAILSDDGPASVHMHILYSEISRKKITDGWIDGLDANLSKSELQALQPRVDAFNKLFTVLKEGDVLRIDYSPGRGTEVRINGEWRGAVEGNDFFRSLLKIWIGSNPISKSLRQGMLDSD
ncbi:MAG: chalcone isomerase family protein [Pseudomonadota bacterium]